jgi:Kef-type K+ transport system membrane component KefB
MRRKLLPVAAALTFVLVARCFAAGTDSSAHGIDPAILMGIAVIWIVAKLFGELFERLKQPAVLGELFAGIVLGSVFLLGPTLFESLKSDPVIFALGQLGVIILLFEVGLESSVSEMLEVGWSSLFVAILGVIFPLVLGWGVSAWLIPTEPTVAHLFIGATLSATSVGITARVLKDMGMLSALESRIILGAAVIDDVLGLIMLAILSGVIGAQSAGVNLAWTGFVWIAAKALLFFVAAFIVNRIVVIPLFRGAGRFESRGVLLTISLAFCFLLAWAATMAGLAAIVGAFSAGLLLDKAHFKSFAARGERTLHELVAPVSFVLTPIFFVLMGLHVDLRELVRPGLFGFALVLTLAAIVGKQVCSLGVVERGLNRLAVGLGMVPRGEVGLIFAGIGSSLVFRNAAGAMEPVIDSSTFGAIVIMVIVTTLITPPALKWALTRGDSQKKKVAVETA